MNTLVIGIIITIGLLTVGILYVIYTEEPDKILIIKDYVENPTVPLSDKTWVEIDPIQCGGNPWEVDWIKSHPDDYGIYARVISNEKMEMIKNYYTKQGITVFGVKMASWGDVMVCDGCSCPAGYTVHLLVYNSYVEKMQDLGFRISEKQTP